jgi:N-sulfoglucosamine sulfohydrolase
MFRRFFLPLFSSPPHQSKVIALIVTPLLNLVATSALSAAEAAAPQTNIILFISDDHSVRDCGAYGATDVKTPHIDRLSNESLRLTQAFAASPSCVPSRSSIYTGLFPMRHGAHPNHGALNPGILTLPDYLKPLGYRTALIGKIHVGFPRGEKLPFDTLLRDPKLPDISNSDEATLHESIQWIKSNKDQPFCLIVCVNDPHAPWKLDERYGYSPDTVTLPPTFLDTPSTREDRTKYYSDITRMDEQLGQLLDAVDEEGLRKNTLFVYTSDQGAQWPFAKWNLYDAGIQVPLLIRWPGIISGGSTSSALVSHVDLLPTFIELAGGKAPMDLDGRSIRGLLEGKTTAGREYVYAAHTGDGLWNIAPMRCLRTDRYKYIFSLMPEVEYTTHIDMYLKKDGFWKSWKDLVSSNARAREVMNRYHVRPEEELYDIKADPSETRNLANDPALAKVREELRSRLAEWRKQQHDDGVGLSKELIERILKANKLQREFPVAHPVLR